MALIAVPAAAQSSSKKVQSSKTQPAKKKSGKVAARHRSRPTPRSRRMHAAFVASTSLKPMARQLLQDRTPAAYAGVEAYARRHTQEDAGALAWLVLGYAHILDKDYTKAVEPLSRAKPRAGDLGEYVDFYLGTAYFQSGSTAEAVATLADFDKDYPESLLLRDARVLYGSALLAANRARDAAAVLEKDRQPPRADLELALGKAYAAAGEPAKAAEILRNLYVTMPLSAEATQADVELKQLASTTQLPPVGLNGRRTRADLLAKGKRFSDAAAEYRDLLSVVSPSDRPEIQMALAVALRRSGDDKEAKKVLDAVGSPAGTEISIQRIFNLGEIARSDNDEPGFLEYLAQLRQAAPTSFLLQQALLSEGNYYLLKPDYDKAIDAYRELQQRFPNAGRASYAHWKVAWLSLRQGRTAEAKTGFEQQIGLYPTSAEIPAALYWRARLAEEDQDPAMARAYYQKISERFRNFYYGELARRRLRELKAGDDFSSPTPYWIGCLPSTPGPISQPAIRPSITCAIRRRKCWRMARWWTSRFGSCRPPQLKTKGTG